MARRRHVSRIVVMQSLFEREKHPGIDPAASLERNANEIGEYDAEYATALLKGVLASEADLKAAVQKHAPEWPTDRMDPISRCLLLVGAYEILHQPEVPPAVVMNEAIEIAKEYGTDESGKFVNGVLNALAKTRSVK